MCEEVLRDSRVAFSIVQGQVLTLAEASARSGYSVGHLGRLVRRGTIPNAGRIGAPRIRESDLPHRPARGIAAPGPRSYDPTTDARSLVSRREGGANGPSNTSA